MKAELEQALYRDFPELFREHSLPMSETCMCWGICCSDHWEPAIRKACQTIMDYFNPRREELKIVPAFSQVKEKFGGLRMYGSRHVNHEFDVVCSNAIQEAMMTAWHTCEHCGAVDAKNVSDKGWLQTLCPKCCAAAGITELDSEDP